MDFTTTEIVVLLSAAFEAEHGVAPRHDRVGLWRLMEAADAARERLSLTDSVTVNLPYMHNHLSLNVRLDRSTLMARRK